jgi:cytolysin-activating lysine-acyltransferase
MHLARLAIQPPIDLLQYKIFRFDGIPRYGVTWAFLSRDAERKVIEGLVLEPKEWRSGNRMWVMEIIAPYGQGTAKEVVLWLKRSLPEEINRVRYLRVGGDHLLQKVIEVRRIDGARWGTHLVHPDQISESE